MEVLHYKLLYIFSILATGLIAGLAPALTGAKTQNERLFSLGNAFGGGVFLGAGLIHLLPDAIDNYSDLLGPVLDYPLASLICAAGFLLVLLIEKVVVGGDEDAIAAEAGQGDTMFPYVLALVLSVHSLVAGMALGAEKHVATSLALFLAVIAHKGFAAFALGVGLHRGAVLRSRAIGIIVLFSVMTPLGIAAGTILGAWLSGRAEQWFEATFDALAAGTFLYVAVVDIVEGEFVVRKDVGIKFSMVLLGIAFMAMVAVWT